MSTEAPDPVRVIGQLTDIHGAPLEIAVYRGTVNVAGRHFDKRRMGQLMRLLTSAAWEAARDGRREEEAAK